MQSTQESQKQRIPVAVVALVLLVSTAAAGWVTYRYVLNPSGAPQARAPMKVESLPAPAQKMSNQPMRVRSSPPGRPSRTTTAPYGFVTRKPGSGIILVHRGDARVRAAPSDDGKDYLLALDYTNPQTWVTPTQWEHHLLAERAVSIANLAAKMNLTDAQKLELRALPDRSALSAVEETELKALIREWESAGRANRGGPVEKLTAAVAKLGEAHREAAKSALMRRVERIPQILSSEQMEAAERYMGKKKSLAVRG